MTYDPSTAPAPSPVPGSLDATLPAAVSRIAASVVGVVTRRSAAAGLVWQPGLVVTSASALWRASRIQLVLPGGEAVEGTLRGSDPGTDLAVLAFDAGSTAAPPAAPTSASASASAEDTPRVGDFVFAVGREGEGGVHASFGHVGAVGGAWRSWRGGQIESLIRLDGGLYPGFAGAPVATVNGPVLGIASPAFSRHHAVVLPASTIDRVLAALLAHGRVPRSHLGIAVQPVRATLDGTATEGLLVSSVAEGGPAAGGGLLVGDVIVDAAARPVRHLDALRAAIAETAPGQALALTVSRAGQRTALTIALAEREQGQAPSWCHRH